MADESDAPSEASATLTFGESDDPHDVGDPACSAGWCDGGSRWPKRCDNDDCPGFVHANFGDENYGGDYCLYTKCDVCGASA